MKKAIFFFAFTLVLGTFSANAQSCCAKAGANKTCADKISKAAAADPSIEKRLADDGTVAYVRKAADAQGNVMFASVQFDEASNAFVNVAPKIQVADKTEMTKKSAACSATEKKACCAGGAAQGKSCCANKAAATCTEKKAEQ